MKAFVKPSAFCAGLSFVALIGLGATPHVAQASYTSTVTSPQTEYFPGAPNTFDFVVHITTNGTNEFVDNISFRFPAGVTVTSATGPSPFNFCGGGQGKYSNPTPETALWSTPGHPSGCGAFASGTYNFSVTVAVPADVIGPLIAIATTEGDGWPPPLTDPQVSTFTFVYQGQRVPAPAPTVSTWGLATLTLLLGGVGVRRVRRNRQA